MTRQGAKDHSVTTLQYLLLAHGHTVTVDGVFGAQTGDAVRAYQRTKDLPEDGVVGPETWQALIVEVRPGERGSAVRGIQHEIGIEADGEFGPETERAVRAFQRRVRGVEADGVVGLYTWQALANGVPAELSQAA
ncbi:peptidoglycan-binding protein [Actinoplanes sp. GCM10030250]|uniref:peptidoglycan-binding domain-containing protein n=1 Tax=Actinoplanes sp. GCM10030250 TaxID=3273376 RepID=UPI0036185C26